MNIQSLIQKWFQCWNDGDFLNIPVSNNFKHTSPFGTICGKEAYLQLVENNRDKFLGYQFQIHDGIYQENIACVRYTGTQGDFSLDVSEWYYTKDNLIEEIIAYYHIGEIQKERQLS